MFGFMKWLANQMESEDEEDEICDRNLMSSEVARKIGNSKFRNKDYRAAISLYNWALIKAENDKVQAALIYGCRAAAYMESGFYKHCLRNLDLAEPHYPREKIQKLHERRDKCLRLNNNKEDMQLENPPDNFHELSYEANPKLPFFIKALELREDATFGRHLITTRDLKAGDVVAVIENPWNFPDTKDIVVTNACYHCMNVNDLDLIPSEKCKGGEHLDECLLFPHIQISYFQSSSAAANAK